MTKLPIFFLVAAASALGGCASGRQARNVQTTDFLGQYKSLLKPGQPEEEPLLLYRNPKANWAGYKKILLEPVTVWGDPNHALSAEQQRDLEQVVDAFFASLRQKLSADYEMADAAGAGVMRARVAIENSQAGKTTLKVASRGVPYGGPAGAVWTLITGKPAFVGETSIEFIVQDGATGELLAAGADRRVGGDSFNKQYLSSWGDVKNALDFWTDSAVYRLCIGRGGPNCIRPKASLLPGS
jgi:hypothetical protein